MRKVAVLTDYKGYYGSKYDALPYNSGLDLNILEDGLKQHGIETYLIAFQKVYEQPVEFWHGVTVIYTSSEDVGYYYKNYIEDVIFYLESIGAVVVPPFKFLRANNNKVFMEFLRKASGLSLSLNASVFGCLEELIDAEEQWNYPIVIKLSEGAMSETVDITLSRGELLKKVSSMARTSSLKEDIKEFVRSKKYVGYITESKYRRKFILQEFVPGLTADFKVLNFGDKYFCFRRPTRKNDFRASGSGNKYYNYGQDSGVTEQLLEYARSQVNKLNIPFVSLDIVNSNGRFHLLEFQALYFGTVGVVRSSGHYEYSCGDWRYNAVTMTVEEVYVHSIAKYLER